MKLGPKLCTLWRALEGYRDDKVRKKTYLEKNGFEFVRIFLLFDTKLYFEIEIYATFFSNAWNVQLLTPKNI